ncbi:grasp-with-spasm system ATP-grasp peptide maturase [Olivibacter sp. XZL3]|uniref:grasp-with-spasm system ATP-grasp peptide maturase n=1 Tax=Olivibacter sp. XZL3 TaxID=1735116 RepID=UPI001065E73E|nr:grasp-with-spasm system ATP-grasp peptide maturase [Olivibacter sp. XZL3]
MLLILSQENFEVTTENIIDWLNFYGVKWVRLNGEDLQTKTSMRFVIGKNGDELILDHKGRNIADCVSTIWFRRTFDAGVFEYEKFDLPLSKPNYHTLVKHLTNEYYAFYWLLELYFEKRRVNWLSKPSTTRINKIRTLILANSLGLKIPETMLTNNVEFLKKPGRKDKGFLITKPITECINLQISMGSLMMYTQRVSDAVIKRMKNFFFPSLFQQEIEKEFEIRSFYLNGKFHSMAIFSQGDEQTKTDFRHYNFRMPNRQVPYKLPSQIEQKLDLLMKSVNLDTGSIDLIKTPQNEYIFLEVNPVGQFGMVSAPCNFNLEKKVAEFLREKEDKVKKNGEFISKVIS